MSFNFKEETRVLMVDELMLAMRKPDPFPI